MTTEALLTALHTLCTSPKHLGTQLTAGMLVRLGETPTPAAQAFMAVLRDVAGGRVVPMPRQG